MRLNRLEFALMNNPGRAALQRFVEAPRLARLGGPMAGGRALELGCGRGVGIGTIFATFGADTVDAFDLDPAMIRRARRRVARHGSRVRLWIGDATAVPAASDTYDAVFDYGIMHHIPEWRRAVSEVARVLKPGGVFYAEEMLAPFITHPISLRLFDHPTTDRFTAAGFAAALTAGGLVSVRQDGIGRMFSWFAAVKPASPAGAGA